MMNPNNKRILLILFGILIVLWIFYNRLIRIRLPRDFLTPISDIRFAGLFIISSTMLLLLVYSICKYYKVLKYGYDYPQGKLGEKVALIYNLKWNPIHLWNEALMELDILIKNNIPRYNKSQSYLEAFLSNLGQWLFKHKTYGLIIFYIILVVTQGIVCVALLYDVLYLGKFYYFYKTLWLILFSISVRYIFYSLGVFVEVNLEQLDEILLIKVISASRYNSETKKEDFHQANCMAFVRIFSDMHLDNESTFYCYYDLKAEYKEKRKNPLIDFPATLNKFFSWLEEFSRIYCFCSCWEIFKKYYFTPFSIVKYLIYSYCWITITLLALNA